tara:strand:- start:502 stop:615 length:114 start_codon:yes stop_codon:yes gene_type:complete
MKKFLGIVVLSLMWFSISITKNKWDFVEYDNAVKVNK